MKKKLWIVISAVLAAALLAGAMPVGPVLAQAGVSQRRGQQTVRPQAAGPQDEPGGNLPARLRRLRPVLGQVAQLSGDTLTLTLRSGETRAFTLADQTRIVDVDRQPLERTDLQEDAWVAVVVRRASGAGGQGLGGRLRSWLAGRQGRDDSAGPLPARLVVVLPEDFDPQDFSAVRGEVTGVDAAGRRLTLEDQDGQSVTVVLDEQTRFVGQARTAQEIKTGMQALAAVEKQADGSLLARRLRAGDPGERPQAGRRIAGRVTAVGADELTLQTRDGEQLTIQVSAETRFRSPGNRVAGLADLQPGMLVIAGVLDQDTGLQAQVITVLRRPRK
ncbi:MAG: DUF5666 domain-containing protein [Chloroflexota bacterium]